MYEKYKNITSNIDPILKNVAVDEEDNKLGFYNFSIYNFDSLIRELYNKHMNLYNGSGKCEGFYTKDGKTSKVLFSNGQFVKLLD